MFMKLLDVVVLVVVVLLLDVVLMGVCVVSVDVDGVDELLLLYEVSKMKIVSVVGLR